MTSSPVVHQQRPLPPIDDRPTSRAASRLARAFGVLVASTLIGTGLLAAPATAAPAPSVTTWWDPDTTSVPLGANATFNVTVPTDSSGTPNAATRVTVDHYVNGQRTGTSATVPAGATQSFPIDTTTLGTTTHTFTFTSAPAAAPFLTAERALTVYGEPTTVSTRWPTKGFTRLHGSAVVRGAVTGALPRTVDLQVEGRAGWDTVATTTTSLTGTYALSIPTSWYTSGENLRVHVPASGPHAAVDAPDGFAFSVTPDYKPRGSKHAYALYGDRWDPCKTVTYKVNPAQMPKTVSTKTIRRAFKMMGEATGITFAYVGRTSMVPFAKKGQRVPGAQIAVGFATPKQVPRLKKDIVGLGGPTRMGRTAADGTAEYIEGQVVFDTGTIAGPGFGSGFTWGELILHEVGHAIGLQHAFKPYQVMSYNTLDDDRFGAGDLTGLQRLGRSAGCFVDVDATARLAAQTSAPNAAASTSTDSRLPVIEPLRADEHGLLGHTH